MQCVQLSAVAHQHTPVRADDHTIFVDRDARGNHSFPMDILCFSRFDKPSLDDNIHSRILNDLTDMASDGISGVNTQKLAVSLRHSFYVTIFVDDHDQFIRCGQHGFQQDCFINARKSFLLFHNTLSSAAQICHSVFYHAKRICPAVSKVLPLLLSEASCGGRCRASHLVSQYPRAYRNSSCRAPVRSPPSPARPRLCTS